MDTSPPQTPTHPPAVASREEVAEIVRLIRCDAADRRRDTAAETDTVAGHGGASARVCAVCLCEAELAVEFLPCYHFFCGRCAQLLWRRCGEQRQIRCPVDHVVVTSIYPAMWVRTDQALDRKKSKREAALARVSSQEEVAPSCSPSPSLLSDEAATSIAKDLARYNLVGPQSTPNALAAVAWFFINIVKLILLVLIVLPVALIRLPFDLARSYFSPVAVRREE